MVEMQENIGLLLPVAVPIGAGAAILLIKKIRQNRKGLLSVVLGTLLLETVLVMWALMVGGQMLLWNITETIPLFFAVDSVSRLFAALTVGVWLLVGIYSVSYMKHEREEHSFFGYYLIVLGVLIGLDFSGNLVTMYVFYEMMTLTSLPLVLHERTKEAVQAGLKYLFYSVAGAFLALFGIFVLVQMGGNAAFTPGGTLVRLAEGGMESSWRDVLSSHRIWRQGRHVPPSWVVAHCPSGGSGSGQCSSFRSDYKIRSSCHSSYCIFCGRARDDSRNLGAAGMDDSDASDCVYGFHAGIQRACSEKKAGLFNSQSGILCAVWIKCAGAFCIYRSVKPYCVPFAD